MKIIGLQEFGELPPGSIYYNLNYGGETLQVKGVTEIAREGSVSFRGLSLDFSLSLTGEIREIWDITAPEHRGKCSELEFGQDTGRNQLFESEERVFAVLDTTDINNLIAFLQSAMEMQTAPPPAEEVREPSAWDKHWAKRLAEEGK